MKLFGMRGVVAAAVVAAFTVAGSAIHTYAAESVLRVAMTAADIPDWTTAGIQ